MATLEFYRAGDLIYTQSVSPRGVRVGRAPDNDLVLMDTMVSTYHLLVFVREGSIRVRDLNSTNGTFVDDVRVQGSTVLAAASTLRLGPELVLAVRLSEAGGEEAARAYVWHYGANRIVPFDDNEVSLAALVQDADLDASWIISAVKGGAVLRTGAEVRRLVFEEEFVIGGARFTVVTEDMVHRSTRNTEVRTSWLLTVDLAARAGPVAELSPPGGGPSQLIRAANRVSVLYLLAQQYVADMGDEVGASDVGWCADDHLMRGVWGRRWEEKGNASFQVLVHRVRKDLARIGIGASVFEKRSGFTRLRPGVLEVAPLS